MTTDTMPKAIYSTSNIYTFAGMPPDPENLFGGHALGGQQREDSLTAFCRGHKSAKQYTFWYVVEYREPVQITDAQLIHWSSQYRNPSS